MTTNHSARVHPVHWCAFPLVIVKPFRKRKSVLFVIILKEGMYTACLGKLFQSWATHTLNRESESESCSVLSNSLQPHGLYSPWNSPGQNTGVGTFPSPGDLPNQGIELWSPALQADSLPAEPQGKPKNTGVHSLSLLQGIFLTQELNQGLLHCRQILYQLSSEGSPKVKFAQSCPTLWDPMDRLLFPRPEFWSG